MNALFKTHKTTKHTPGPWKVCGSAELCDILPQADIAHIGDYTIANPSVQLFKTDETCKANARLIAAAPELLEACQRIKTRLQDRLDEMELNNKPAHNTRKDLDFIEAAIAKATGGLR